MKVEQLRYAIDNSKPVIEKITWISSDEVGLPITDARLRPLSNYPGILFFAVAVQNPLLDITAFSEYQNSDGSYNIPGEASYYGVTTAPLRPGISIVTEAAYNAAVTQATQAAQASVDAYLAEQAIAAAEKAAQEAASIARFRALGFTDDELRGMGFNIPEVDVVIGGQG
jgi:hypothetical protein